MAHGMIFLGFLASSTRLTMSSKPMKAKKVIMLAARTPDMADQSVGGGNSAAGNALRLLGSLTSPK